MSLIKTIRLTKSYQYGKSQAERGIKDISVCINKGDFIALRGTSGAGKSTFLNILGSIDKPASGKYYFDNEEVGCYTPIQAAKFRLNKIAFIFQSFHLLSTRTIVDNVSLPLFYAGYSKERAHQKARKVLCDLNLEEHLSKPAANLSRGQQQRVAIARALVNNPQLILADEPTGNLDATNTTNILEILKNINEKVGTTIIMASHEDIVNSYANRLFTMKDGELIV